MENVIIYLLGYAGTGKYTVAKEISARTGFVLVDNHLINNPIFSVVGADGKTPLPPEVWDEVGAVRGAVLRTIAQLAKPTASFIFTNELYIQKDGAAWYADIENVAIIRRALFLPVFLTCEREEHLKRVIAPERAARWKETNTTNVAQRRETMELFKPDHENLFELDITNVKPADAAQKIEKRLKEILL